MKTVEYPSADFDEAQSAGICTAVIGETEAIVFDSAEEYQGWVAEIMAVDLLKDK